MTLASVEGFTQYKKDTSNGGVINTDKRSYENYKTAQMRAAKKAIEEQQASVSIQAMQNEINSIKSDLTDIKTILTQLLEKR